jgi:hypothetical protein
VPGACLAKDELTAMIDREHKVSLGGLLFLRKFASECIFLGFFSGSITRWDRRSNYSS